jgi:hypothetical protein
MACTRTAYMEWSEVEWKACSCVLGIRLASARGCLAGCIRVSLVLISVNVCTLGIETWSIVSNCNLVQLELEG